MANPKKISVVNVLTEKLQQAKAAVFVDYRGLTHKQLEELRRGLKKAGSDIAIAKNSLIFRALKETGEKFGLDKNNSGLMADLQGPTAAVFAYEDETAPLKEIAKMTAQYKTPVFKFGFLGQSRQDSASLQRISHLPGRETLTAQCLFLLKFPLFGLHRALQWNLNKLVRSLEAVKAKKV